MLTRTSPPKSEKGNILFLILLAVVLFAALAYAVTSSMRGGGKDASSEKASSVASELLNYFSQLDVAVQRMMVANDVKDYELSFYSPGNILGMYDNTNCTANRCRVFHPDGGGVSARQSSPGMRRDGNSNAARIFAGSIPGAGTDLPDLAISFSGIRTDVCKDINDKMGLGNAPLLNANWGSATILYFSTPYPTGPWISNFTLGVPQQAGIAGTFCHCTGTTVAACEADNLYPTVTHVLIAR